MDTPSDTPNDRSRDRPRDTSTNRSTTRSTNRADDTAELLLSAVTAMETAVCIADATDPELPLVYVNPAFERMTGYTSAEVLGRNARFMQGPDSDESAVRAMRDGIRAGRPTRSRLVNYRADGSSYWVDVHLSPVRDAGGRLTRYVAVQHDVTEEVLAQLAAAHAATRDGLTGLMNRAAFATGLTREIARAQRRGTSVGVLFLDVDDFKGVNDRYGHLVGDGYLVHVAECLRQRLRGDDAAARIGGDEFIALVTDLPGDGAAAVARVVDDLSAAFARPFVVDGVEHRMSVAIGTAVHPRDGATVRDLVAAADAHMYVHKARRANGGGPQSVGPGSGTP